MLGVMANSMGYGKRSSLVASATEIPGITVYFDATNNTFNPNSLDGTTISQWTDSSGASHNANPDGGAAVKPTVRTNVKNGKTVLRFDGGDNLSVTSTSYLQNKAGFTMYVVAKVTNYNPSSNTTLTSSNATGGGMKIFNNGTNWGVRIAGCTGISTAVGDSNFRIFGLIYDGNGVGNSGKIKFRYAGADQALTFTGTAANTTSATITEFYVGNEAKLELLDGDVGEVAMWTKALSTSELIAFESYLKNKWAI